jgi:hypothetical protein
MQVFRCRGFRGLTRVQGPTKHLGQGGVPVAPLPLHRIQLLRRVARRLPRRCSLIVHDLRVLRTDLQQAEHHWPHLHSGSADITWQLQATLTR